MTTIVDSRDTRRPLWASSSGRIACDEHVPEIGSGAWWGDHWTLVDEFLEALYARGRGALPECEACTAIALRGRIDEMRRHLGGEPPDGDRLRAPEGTA